MNLMKEDRGGCDTLLFEELSFVPLRCVFGASGNEKIQQNWN